MPAMLSARSFRFRPESGDKLIHNNSQGYRNSQQSLHQGERHTQGSIKTTPFEDITPPLVPHNMCIYIFPGSKTP
jgi:hypothetical protein